MLDQKQGNLILIDQKRKFAGHVRPETGKHDLNQNNVGLKTGKPDLDWSKRGKLPKTEKLA